MTADGIDAVRARPLPGVALRQAGRAADAVARGLVLLLPVLLVHLRVGAEIGFHVVTALFLVRSTLGRRWSWVRRDWVVAGLVWWTWTVACTARAALVERARNVALEGEARPYRKFLQECCQQAKEISSPAPGAFPAVPIPRPSESRSRWFSPAPANAMA